MADATGNQEIIEVVYVVRADDAIANAERMRSSINAIKTDIQNLASQSGASFRELAEGMKKAFGSEQMAAIADARKRISAIRTSDLTAEDKTAKIAPIRAEIDARIAAWREYKQFVNKALEELNAAERKFVKESVTRDKERSAQRKAFLKEEKDVLQQYITAWRESQKTGEMGVMTKQAQEMGAKIQDLKQQIVAYAQQNGVSFNKAAQDIYNKGTVPINQMRQAVRELNAEMKNTSAGGGGILGFFQNLGTVGQFVFGSVLGITAISVLRNLVNWFKEVAAAGFEYAQALKRLEISTQILQERGVNITMKETLDLVNELNRQFPIFTRKQIVEGVGYIQLLSQNLGLSTKQMKDLNEVAGSLAVVLGKDVNEAAKELALFLSSGYGEALQRAGILASKQAVVEELRRMGIQKGYNDVDQATRAQAGYNVIMRDANKLVEKSTELQKDNAYALNRTKQAWQGLKDAFGARLTTPLALVLNLLTDLIKLLGQGYQKAAMAYAQAAAQSTFATLLFAESFKFLINAVQNSFNPLYNFKDELRGFVGDMLKVREELFKQSFGAALPDIFVGFEDSIADAASGIDESKEMIIESVKELHKRLIDEQTSFNDDMDSLWKDYQRDLEQLEIDAARKREEVWIDYSANLAEIARKAADDVIAENTKYQLDLLQINREYSQKREDAEQKYRDKEAKAEKDFQEKLRRLREEFLFDLEDALRERDARQVLRLIRRFNLEQARLERERTSAREDRENEYRRELEDIDAQKAERLRKLSEEHQARLLEIRRQAQIEIRELGIKNQAELAEIDRRLVQEQTDRLARYEQQKADREEQFKKDLERLGLELGEELGLTQEMLNRIYQEYLNTYGPDGLIPQVMNGFLIYLAQVNAEISRQIQMLAGMMAGAFSGSEPKNYQYYQPPASSFSGIEPKSGSGYYGYATGAKDMLVTSPKIIKVGEVPELINITPLNRLSSAERVGEAINKNGTINIELWLSPDLQARVMDNTMSELANVMLNIQRSR